MERGFFDSGDKKKKKKEGVSSTRSDEFPVLSAIHNIVNDTHEVVKPSHDGGSASKVPFEAVGASAKSSTTGDDATNFSPKLGGSFANLLKPNDTTNKIHFCTLVNDERVESVDCVLPKDATAKVKSRYENSIVARDTKATVMEEKDDGFKEVKSRKKKKGADSRSFGGLRLNKPNSKVIWQQKKSLTTANPFDVLNGNGDDMGESETQPKVSDHVNSVLNKIKDASKPSSSNSGYGDGNKDMNVRSPPVLKKWDVINESDTTDDEAVSTSVGGGNQLEDEDSDFYDRYKDQVVDLHGALKEYRAVGASTKDQPKVNSNFRPLVVDPVFDGVNISIPRKVVEKVSTRLEHTLYGYFIGKRLAFPVVDHYARNNWAKHGLKRIMTNTKGFFFFKFDSRAGLEAVLESGPWLIRKSPIILKKWSMDTRLLKEELTRIPIWVKLHDVPIQVFKEDGISLIAIFIGKPVMLDSYTSSMCNDSWGRSNFARCLIEINSEADLVDVVTISVPSLTGDDFTRETIRVGYEWRPPRCDVCKIFDHLHDLCPKNEASPSIVSTSDVVTLTDEKTNDVIQNVIYEPKAATSVPKKGATNVGNPSNLSSKLRNTGTSFNKDNITSPNSFSALNVEEGKEKEEEEEAIENVYDETANIFSNTKTGGSSSFTAVAG
nr:zinc knuckle CX2CX4HX4C [Tanacetum cinerariifolium]